MCRRSVGRENFAFNVVKVFLLYSLIDCAVCELMGDSYCGICVADMAWHLSGLSNSLETSQEVSEWWNNFLSLILLHVDLSLSCLPERVSYTGGQRIEASLTGVRGVELQLYFVAVALNCPIA